MPRIFVYGTLKTGHGNNYVLKDQRSLGRHVLVSPWTLVDLGYFPGLCFDASNESHEVLGELYEVNPDVVDILDMIEGHPHFYSRAKYHGLTMYVLPPDYLKYDRVAKHNSVQVWRPSEEDRRYIDDGRRNAEVV